MFNILVVDCLVAERELLATMLESKGAIIVQLDNTEDAIKTVNEQSFDLVFMEAVMPVINGFSAVKIIKDMPGMLELPIVISKANLQPTDRMWALRQGAVGAISKPYTTSAVFEFTRELNIIKLREDLDQNLIKKTVDFFGKTKI